MSNKCNFKSRWEKYENNPVLGGSYGTCFDVAVILEGDTYRMYFSWRTMKSIALVESKDGINWSEPVIVLGPRKTELGWEDDLNRPTVVKCSGIYHMWYTGQYKPGEPDGMSWIFYAVSNDGIKFERAYLQPVISPEEPWEKKAVMCPSVIWDEKENIYKMWYSGGEQFEPNAIGNATSRDGINWAKSGANPVFYADPGNDWERHKTTACQVIYKDGWYVMFYIGFHDEHFAQIGIARSCNGISDWVRHHGNPVISPDQGKWDSEACYKPYALFDGTRWMLWYNGRTDENEQIGLAVLENEDLGFL